MTTSGSGLFGTFGQSNYGAAKAGLIGLMHVLAIEVQRNNIRVNAISPIVRTRMTENTMTESCERTANIYRVGGKHVSRVFIAETAGADLEAPTAGGLRRPYRCRRRCGELHDSGRTGACSPRRLGGLSAASEANRPPALVPVA